MHSTQITSSMLHSSFLFAPLVMHSFTLSTQHAGETAMQPFHASPSLKSVLNVSMITQNSCATPSPGCVTFSKCWLIICTWAFCLCLSHTITFLFSIVVQFRIRKEVVTKGWKKTTGKVSFQKRVPPFTTCADFVLYSCQANYKSPTNINKRSSLKAEKEVLLLLDDSGPLLVSCLFFKKKITADTIRTCVEVNFIISAWKKTSNEKRQFMLNNPSSNDV